MTIIMKSLLYGTLALSNIAMSASASTTATNYKTEICYSCNSNNAITFAKQYPPTVECKVSGPFDYDYTQQCYSQPRDVLIINANSGQKWYFKLSHANQGSFRYQLELQVTPQSLPNNANALANELLNYYTALDRTVAKISEQYQSQTMQSELQAQAQESRFGRATESPNNCENTPITRAAHFAYNGHARTRLRSSLHNQFIDEFSSVRGAFDSSRITAFNFSVSRGSVELGGSWEYVPETRFVQVDFYDPSNGHHTVAYNVHSGQGGRGLTIKLNEDMTKFGGRTIADWKSTRPEEVSNCMLEVLNKHLKAGVTGDTGGGGGGVDIPPSYDLIPARSWGGGGGSGPQTCTWTFYDPWGEPYFSMEGACP
ncbi:MULTISPECIES: hypothetical protein [unclassified Pseudoalteromonas]|uniref:hypothetical protein n=1 Tax=unclassified Pseudoalteromonas TaxID=194690 RepID=UPI003015341B